MKQLTARLVDIAKAQNTQVEGAKQDSLVLLESRLSAVTELPHALRDARIVPVGSVAPETFSYQSLRTQNGAVAALNVDGPLLDIALYHIQGFCRIQFTGTIANASLWTVSLLDPVGPNEFPLAEAVLASSPLIQIVRVILASSPRGCWSMGCFDVAAASARGCIYPQARAPVTISVR